MSGGERLGDKERVLTWQTRWREERRSCSFVSISDGKAGRRRSDGTRKVEGAAVDRCTGKDGK